MPTQLACWLGRGGDHVSDREIIALLREVLAGQRDILAAIERGRASHAKRDPEPAVLLWAIFPFVGKLMFTVSELREYAALLENESLREVIGAFNGRALGKLLKRVEGRDADGLRLEHVSAKDRDGVTWILRVCDFETRKPALPVAARSPVVDDRSGEIPNEVKSGTTR